MAPTSLSNISVCLRWECILLEKKSRLLFLLVLNDLWSLISYQNSVDTNDNHPDSVWSLLYLQLTGGKKYSTFVFLEPFVIRIMWLIPNCDVWKCLSVTLENHAKPHFSNPPSRPPVPTLIWIRFCCKWISKTKYLQKFK